MSTSTTKRTKRRSTVQDYATLRLRLDGRRVKLHSPQRSDLYFSRARKAGHDARGNRVARDAAGLGVVPKRPATLEDRRVETVSSGPDISEDESRSAKPRRGNRRKRRRLNHHDVEFLRDSGNVPGSAKPARDTSWPVPSSDLLKCVNYFACQYYAARGLLLDRSRVYSCGKEQRRAEDQQKVRTGGNGDGPFVADGEDGRNAKREDRHERDSTEREGAGASSKGLPGMYKALDGSALVAIGMLLQELVSTLLKPNVPPEWEKEMGAAGLVPSGGSISPENERAEETQSDKSEDEDIWDESSSDDKD
ncbi:hypothetical protein BJY52DRAFT_772868 [Lactarius psammicola]|nr:hypothetical protein BJY52DRAFT_772868 [Lactarius psammicola]